MHVSEIFTSIQGEGLHMGRVALFIRLAGCNLDCTWCDTPQRATSVELSVDAIRSQVVDATTQLIVVTGGEPLLQAPELEELLTSPGMCDRTWHLETNGTIFPGLDVLRRFSHIVVSPKLSSAGPQRLDPLSKWDSWMGFMQWCVQHGGPVEELFCVKFVVGESTDLTQIQQLLDSIPLQVPIVLQPEDGGCETAVKIVEKQIRNMTLAIPLAAMSAQAHNVRVLPRLHRLLYGDQQGV